MRNMRILVDTNVLLDYFLDREPFAGEATQIFELCEEKKVQGCVAAHSIPNIFFILRHRCPTDQRKKLLLTVCETLHVVGINRYKIIASLENADLAQPAISFINLIGE